MPRAIFSTDVVPFLRSFGACYTEKKILLEPETNIPYNATKFIYCNNTQEIVSYYKNSENSVSSTFKQKFC